MNIHPAEASKGATYGKSKGASINVKLRWASVKRNLGDYLSNGSSNEH